jgi:hypothetical protein
MSPLDALAPDQRAVVALVLRPGGRYEAVATVLGMPVAAVRSRAHAGLAALAPRNGLPAEITGPLADYVLGQLSEADAAATRGLMAESAPARAWAAGVAQALAPDAPQPLPEIPGEPPPAEQAPPSPARPDAETAPRPDAETAPRPDAPRSPAQPESEPADEHAGPEAAPAEGAAAPPPSSRLGGAVLIVGVAGVAALVLFLVLRGGDDPEAPPVPAAVATATPTATPAAATAQVTDQIDLRPVDRSGAAGRMTVFLQDGRLLFQIQAQDVPPSGSEAAYAVWFTGPGTRARRLGYTDPVGQDGALGIQGPSDADLDDFPRLYATYAHVVVSRETDDGARRPGRPVLRGPLPRGR